MAMLGLTNMRPNKMVGSKTGLAVYLDRPEMSVDVFFKAVFFALQKPGWHGKVIDSAFKCLKMYASFKSNNFSSPTTK